MGWSHIDSVHGDAKNNHAQKRRPDVSATPGQADREYFSHAAENGSHVHVAPDEVPTQVLCPSL